MAFDWARTHDLLITSQTCNPLRDAALILLFTQGIQLVLYALQCRFLTETNSIYPKKRADGKDTHI